MVRDDSVLKPVDWTGEQPPNFPDGSIPAHVAIVMDGNGRWANQRGLPRTEGHRAGEAALLDVIAGAIQAGVRYLSVYAFSTENWKRSPAEVRFLMGFNREVLRRQRDQLHAWGVRVVWSGSRTRLWKSVAADLDAAAELTKHNTGLTLNMCVNYGGRVELRDAMREIAAAVAAGRLSPERIREQHIAQHLYQPALPEVDLFLRSSGEQRTSNFLPWQAAYAELVFVDTLWPDFTRAELWRALETFIARDRRFGGAVDAPAQQ